MKMKMKPHTFCSYCGTPFGNDIWPRVCAHCKNTTWRNPLPVIVTLVPYAEEEPRRGFVDLYGNSLVVVRRDIEPSKGELCLPGGYIDHGETWQHAAARELWEETGIDIRSEDENFIKLVTVRSATNSNVLIFAKTRVMHPKDLPPFVPNHECSERAIIKGPQQLAFVKHTELAAMYFRGEVA